MISSTRKSCQIFSLILAGLVCVSLSLSGCEPLRKKFTRKSKKERTVSTETVPILDPEDYPDKPFDPYKEYKYRYSMWNVWYKDYLMATEENTSDKRQSYILGQMVVQLDEMQKLLAAEKQQALEKEKGQLQQVVEDFKTPSPLRNAYIIKSKVMLIDKHIRRDFRPGDVQKSLQ